MRRVTGLAGICIGKWKGKAERREGGEEGQTDKGLTDGRGKEGEREDRSWEGGRRSGSEGRTRWSGFWVLGVDLHDV